MERHAPADVLEAAGGIRGHYWVFTLESLLEIIECANLLLSIDWEVIATEETDSKAGNGHTVVIQKRQFPGLGIVGDVSEKLDDFKGPKFPARGWTTVERSEDPTSGWNDKRLMNSIRLPTPEAKRHISTDSFIGPDGKMGFLPPIPPSAAWTPPTPEESDLVQALHDEGSFSEKFLNCFATDDEETPDKL